MKKLLSLFAVAGLLFTAACESSISTAERLTLVNNTIETTNLAAGTALQQDRISTETACRIVVYSRLARSATDAGFAAYVSGDPDSAATHMRAAVNILNGVSQEAIAQADKQCGGGS